MSYSVRPHRQLPTRLPRPWGSPDKNTGVGCHFLLQCMKVKSESEVAQSCPTLSDSMDCSLPGSSIHGIFQASVFIETHISKERIERFSMMCLLARICRCYMHLSLIADMQSLFGKATPFQQVTIIGYLFSPVKRRKPPSVVVPGNCRCCCC